jgi:hypothetical protein
LTIYAPSDGFRVVFIGWIRSPIIGASDEVCRR